MRNKHCFLSICGAAVFWFAAPFALAAAEPTVPPPVVVPPATAPAAMPTATPAPPGDTSAAVAAPVVPAPAGTNLLPAGTDTATATLPSAQSDLVSPKSEVLLIPIPPYKNSLLFSKTDIEHITPFITAYDNIKAGDPTTGIAENDDLTSLLESVKAKNDAQNASAVVTPPSLPALYVGSIVYYSPSLWSVWLNGKKLVNTHNNPLNEFYVSRISSNSVELIWKPASLLNVTAVWKTLTQNGTVALPNIDVDKVKGTITLVLHTNQTFLPRSLAIHEGLVKSINVPVQVDTPASVNAPLPLAGNLNRSIKP